MNNSTKGYNRPLVSVIVPVFGVEDCIEYCARSIFAQSYPNIEYIFVDDCSPDDSIKVLGRIIDDYPNRKGQIIIIRHDKNKGIAEARNDGIEVSKGDYICFVDSDDYIHSQMIETMVGASSDEVSFSMVYGKRTAKRDEQFDASIPSVTICEQDAMMSGLFGTSDQEIQYQAIWNKCFPKGLIKDLRFKDIVAEDVEFMMRVYLNTKKVALVPHEMYYYYQRPDSITHQDTNSNNQIVRERFIHNLDTYYQIYTYIPESKKQYQAMSLWKLYKRIFNVWYYAYNTPYKEVAKTTIHDVKRKTWHQTMENPCLSTYKKWIIRLLYHFPALYRLMMWWNNRK